MKRKIAKKSCNWTGNEKKRRRKRIKKAMRKRKRNLLPRFAWLQTM